MPRLAALLLTLISLPALAAPLAPFTANYQVIVNSKVIGLVTGSATHELSQLPDGNWRFSFQAKALMGGWQQQSDYTVRGDDFFPLVYAGERRLLFKGRKTTIGFNWPKKTATIQTKGGKRSGTSEVSLAQGGLDPLTLELQIRQDLATGRISKEKEYVLIDDKGLRPQRFRVIGEEIVDLGTQKYNTIKVERIHDDPERQTQFWFAKELDYLPVRVMQLDEGEKFLFDLQNYTPTAKAAGEAKKP